MSKAVFEIEMINGVLVSKNKYPIVYENTDWIVTKTYGGEERPEVYRRKYLNTVADFKEFMKERTQFKKKFYAGDKESFEFFSNLKKPLNMDNKTRLLQLKQKRQSLVNSLQSKTNYLDNWKRTIKRVSQECEHMKEEISVLDQYILDVKITIAENEAKQSNT